MRLPTRLDVLRLRNFRNLYIGEAVSMFGDGLFPVALTSDVAAHGAVYAHRRRLV